jgi:hypothetical protein
MLLCTTISAIDVGLTVDDQNYMFVVFITKREGK